MDMNNYVKQPPGNVASSSSDSSAEELRHMPLAPPKTTSKKRLCKQFSMRETSRDIAWEKRRRQILKQERKRKENNDDSAEEEMREDIKLTDEDLHELKGCIELGFGFNEEEGQRLCPTLPLDLYFSVNRQFSPSQISSPSGARHSTSSMGGRRASSFGSPSPSDNGDGWKICSQGTFILLYLLCRILDHL